MNVVLKARFWSLSIWFVFSFSERMSKVCISAFYIVLLKRGVLFECIVVKETQHPEKVAL